MWPFMPDFLHLAQCFQGSSMYPYFIPLYGCIILHLNGGFPGGSAVKESTCQRRCWRCRFDPWVEKIPWRRKWLPTPVFLPGKSHGQKSLAGYSPWALKESDTPDLLSTSILMSLTTLSLFSSIVNSRAHPLSILENLQ